ncbi:hypothetical protein ONZ45_g14947 [Pleurotus djamor]|nr:hypothetical protein ONZ45_g14947 [Pleurotus djamor]
MPLIPESIARFIFTPQRVNIPGSGHPPVPLACSYSPPPLVLTSPTSQHHKTPDPNARRSFTLPRPRWSLKVFPEKFKVASVRSPRSPMTSPIPFERRSSVGNANRVGSPSSAFQPNELGLY